MGAKDEQIAALASALEASLARERLLELRLEAPAAPRET
jgi:hypothetical protein